MSGPNFDDARDLTFERVGLGYRADHVAKGVTMRIDRINESRGELHGELTVERVPEGHLLRSRFNVSSMAARKGTATFLNARSNSVDWTSLLESFCIRVLDAERAGEPFVTVGGDRAMAGAVPYVLPPFVPLKRATILFGDGGAGKSTLATAIAVSVSTGTVVIPGPAPTIIGPVLVLDWEADADEWHERVVAVSKGAGVEPPTVHYRGCIGPLTGQVEEVAALADRIEAVLIVVDSVGMASPSAREGTDANEAALRLFSALREIGSTSLLIDHVSKSGAEHEGGARKPYGSVYKSNLARSTWEVMAGKSSEDEQHIGLYHRKANRSALHRPIGLRVIHGTDGEIVFYPEMIQETETLPAPATMTIRIQRVLLRGPLTVPDLSAEVDADVASVRTTVHRAAKKGLLVKLPNEMWGLTTRDFE